MRDYSIDLETLGNTPYSVIIAIGITGFNRDTGELADEGLELTVSAEDCVRHGLQMDASTVIWWMNQSEEARTVFKPNSGCSLEYACMQIAQYLDKTGAAGGSCFWGNGAGFDVNLLEDMFRAAGKPCPWKFWQARDVRTVVDLAEIDKEAYRGEGHHTALVDAIAQANMVIDGVAKLRGAA